MKRLPVAIFFLLLLSILFQRDSTAYAEIHPDPKDFQYELLDDGSVKILSCKPIYEYLIIPEELDGHPVSSLGENLIDSTESDDAVDLRSVLIPDSVTEIEVNPFAFCPSLEQIKISSRHPTLAMISGVLFSKPDKALICCPQGLKLENYRIPEGIQQIAPRAFYNNNTLQAIYIPDSVVKIGWHAFSKCSSLKSVVIPKSVSLIEDGAFLDCQGLESVTLPYGITKISRSTFFNCFNLQSIKIPESVTEIGDYAIGACIKLTNITIPNSVRSLGICSFGFCKKLEAVEISPSVTTISEKAFIECDSLKTVIIPKTVKFIGKGAFDYCPNLTATVEEGSVGERFCNSNGIPLIYGNDTSWLTD